MFFLFPFFLILLLNKERKNMEGITVKTIYEELKKLRNELTVVRYALIPEEEISAEELKDILRIDKEMEEGKRIKLEDVLEKL